MGNGGNALGLSVANGSAGSTPIANVQGSFSSDADLALVALEIRYLPGPGVAAILTAGVTMLWILNTLRRQVARSQL